MSSVFISHSSASAAAGRIERAFARAGFTTWLDNSDLGVGTLLRNALTDAIRQSRAVVLVWSEPASRSRWVSSEILTAFHMNRFILPCIDDDTPLPQFLSQAVYLDLRKGGNDALGRLVRAAEQAPAAANRLPPRVASFSLDLHEAYDRLARLQQNVTGPLQQRDLAAAAAAQLDLDPENEGSGRRDVAVPARGVG